MGESGRCVRMNTTTRRIPYKYTVFGLARKARPDAAVPANRTAASRRPVRCRLRRLPALFAAPLPTRKHRMPAIAFDRFYRYADLTAILEGLAAEHPGLVTIESAGKSFEGRDIWVLTATNLATGPAADKPAFWVDGNIHATEVAASAASLYFLHTLVTQYGSDPE